MTGQYRFADQITEIDSIFSAVHEYCVDYIASGNPDLRIKITPEDISVERKKYERMAEHEGLPLDTISDADLEKLAVYRKLAMWLPNKGVFLMHGSAVAADGEGYLFTARSGTGKSTHTRLWRQLLGERALMINDDKPLIRIGTDGNAFIYGTPWDGKHRLSTNTSVHLKVICVLERSAGNRIEEITKADAYPILLQQVYRPDDPVCMAKTLELIDGMKVKFFRLGCNQDISAAELSYKTMRG